MTYILELSVLRVIAGLSEHHQRYGLINSGYCLGSSDPKFERRRQIYCLLLIALIDLEFVAHANAPSDIIIDGDIIAKVTRVGWNDTVNVFILVERYIKSISTNAP